MFLSFLSMLLIAIWASFGANATPRYPQGICSHGPDDRACWGKYSLSTNYYEESPDTGVVREYWFNVENKTMALDGVERIVLSVNGMVPGPTIIANWGDTVVVHVTNSLMNNGTSIHFHGLRQFETNQMDGPTSITQCPIAPGDSFTYRWVASQYGSSWYHAHFAVQTWDGVYGGIIINGPATENYDEDKGTIILSDWDHRTAPVLALEARQTGPPQMVSGLINGTNVFNGTGSRFKTQFVAGTSYRLRIINAAADTHFRFTIDDHIMTVIASDFVPIEPNKETSGRFWMRAIAQLTCSNHANPDNIRGIIEYVSHPDERPTCNENCDPTTTAHPTIDSCDDEDMKKLVPRLSIPASPNVSQFNKQAVSLQQLPNRLFWTMNNSSFVAQWDYPTLQQIAERNNTYGTEQNLIRLPKKNEWAYFKITTDFNTSHPIHFHGHDFWVLAAGHGSYNESIPLQLENGPRRDVAMLPSLGYLIIAIIVDNPGIWLAHCHIAWHAVEGFAIQLLELEDEMHKIDTVYNKDSIENTCRNWRSYIDIRNLEQDDSGL